MFKLTRKTALATSLATVAILGTGVAVEAFVQGKGSTPGNNNAIPAQGNQTLGFALGAFSGTLQPGVTRTATLTITNANTYKVGVGSLEIADKAMPGADAAALGTVSVSVGAPGTNVLDKNSSTTATVTIVVEDSETVDQTSLLGGNLSFTVKTK